MGTCRIAFDLYVTLSGPRTCITLTVQRTRPPVGYSIPTLKSPTAGGRHASRRRNRARRSRGLQGHRAGRPHLRPRRGARRRQGVGPKPRRPRPAPRQLSSAVRHTAGHPRLGNGRCRSCCGTACDVTSRGRSRLRPHWRRRVRHSRRHPRAHGDAHPGGHDLHRGRLHPRGLLHRLRRPLHQL